MVVLLSKCIHMQCTVAHLTHCLSCSFWLVAQQEDSSLSLHDTFFKDIVRPSLTVWFFGTSATYVHGVCLQKLEAVTGAERADGGRVRDFLGQIQHEQRQESPGAGPVRWRRWRWGKREAAPEQRHGSGLRHSSRGAAEEAWLAGGRGLPTAERWAACLLTPTLRYKQRFENTTDFIFVYVAVMPKASSPCPAPGTPVCLMSLSQFN